MKDSNEMVKELFERREKYYIERQRKIGNFKKVVSSLACCLVVILVVGIPVTNYFSEPEDDNSLAENIQNVEVNYQPSIKKEMPLDDIDDLEDSSSALQNEETKTSNEADEEVDTEIGEANITNETVTEGVSIDISQKEYSDAPVSDNFGSTGALIPYEAVWGGSYPNEAGQWVVLLTENTAENQKKVFELNPSLTEDNTIFMTATYSLSYLKELQKNISEAVGNGGEFSFVSSVGLREEANCVQVIVTTDDPGSIGKILSFDTLGGAIEIVNISSFVVPEESKKGRMP